MFFTKNRAVSNVGTMRNRIFNKPINKPVNKPINKLEKILDNSIKKINIISRSSTYFFAHNLI